MHIASAQAKFVMRRLPNLPYMRPAINRNVALDITAGIGPSKRRYMAKVRFLHANQCRLG